MEHVKPVAGNSLVRGASGNKCTLGNMRGSDELYDPWKRSVREINHNHTGSQCIEDCISDEEGVGTATKF